MIIIKIHIELELNKLTINKLTAFHGAIMVVALVMPKVNIV